MKTVKYRQPEILYLMESSRKVENIKTKDENSILELRTKIRFSAFNCIKNIVSKKIDTSRDYSDEDILQIIDDEISLFGRNTYLSIDDKLYVRKRIFNSMRRLDVLQDLIEDESITEIMVNGHENIFIEREGRLSKTELKFESADKMNDIIQQITSSVNRSINEAHPIVDARLSDGSRVNVVLPPVSLEGPILTIRKFNKTIMTIERLIELGTLNSEAADFLKKLVLAGYNILCSGGTGSGKTTMLNALAEIIPKEERVITIEDSAELIINNQPNLVRMESRNANVEGKNEIKIRDLIRTALRMRPDRLIVGEVRGKETIDMLQALNTGHTGMSTGHANSPKDMLLRLETMVLLDENIPLQAIRAQIASAIDIIIGVSRMRDGTRKITSVYEVGDYINGEIELTPLFIFSEDSKRSTKDKVIGSLIKKYDLQNTEKLRIAGLV
jgi:pilus assembly protein CpaF